MAEKHTNSDLSFIRNSFESFFENIEENLQKHDTKIYDEAFEKFVADVVIPNKNKIPRLYRYSCADYYNIRNLETETLMLSSIGNMNDIFEGLSGKVEADAIISLDDLKDIAFIKSFTEKKNDFLMWSHYGDKYAGMCVEYDFSKLEKEVLYHLFPVIYSNRRYNFNNFSKIVNEFYNLKKDNKEFNYPDFYESLLDIMELFLRKSSSWKYEKEWRFVATYPHIYNTLDDFYKIDSNEACTLFSLNSRNVSVKNCINAVYLGPRIGDIQKKHIIEICNKLNGVKVYELSISPSNYAFEEKECN